MSLDALKDFARGLQTEIKRCQRTEPLNPAGIRDQTLEGLIKEKDKFKDLALNE